MFHAGNFSINTRAAFLLLLLTLHSPCIFAQMVLTMDNSLEIAKENSPNIRRTRLYLERSRELLKAQQAALKSHFSLTVNPLDYNRDQTFNRFLSAWSKNESKESFTRFTVSQPIEWTDGTLNVINNWSWQDSYSDYQDIRNKSYTNNLYLQFTQPIFTYNRTRLETRSLELDLERNQLDLAIQELALELQIAQIFFNVYRSKMNLDIALEEQQNQEESYQIISNKVEAGLAPLEDLYQAELNLATSKSTVLQREMSLEDALDEFKRLIGVPISEKVTVQADVAYQPVEVNLEKALKNGLEKRLELRQQQIDIENSQFNLIQTSARNEFKGNINFTYGIKGNDEQLADLLDKPTKTQNFSLSFDIPLWDWGEKNSRIKADQATIASRKVSLDDENNSITVGIRKAYRSLKNYVVQIDIAEKSVRNAELTYEINLERYKNGDLSSMDLNLFQEQLSRQKMGLIESLIDYKLALLDLKTQSLWDFEKNQPVIP
jgi:outer membrane protein